MKQFWGELSVSVVLLTLLFLLFNPFDIFMPTYVAMMLLVSAVVFFAAFAIFIWKEQGGDERENFHRLYADRIAYLIGSAMLLAGIVAGELAHALNPWLVFALVAMVLAKTVGFVYIKLKL